MPNVDGMVRKEHEGVLSEAFDHHESLGSSFGVYGL